METRKKIDREFQQIKDFFSEHEIEYVEVSKNTYALEFTLKVKSYISKDKTGKGFKFQLVLEKINNTEVSYKIFIKKGFEVPYHPNFRFFSPFPSSDLLNKYTSTEIFSKKASWVGSLKKHADVVDYVKEMILSLQFHENYINTENIGNKKAYHWYSDQIVKKKDIFPTDNFLEHLIDSNPSKQSSKKTFNIDSDKNEKKSNEKPQFTIKKKFSITAKEEYELEEKILVDETFKTDEDFNSENKKLQSEARLYISQKAKKQIWNHIEWGNHYTKNNKNEQGGILLGKVFFDKEKEIQFAIVEDVVVGKTAKGNPTYLEMSHETWAQMLNDADQIIEDKNDNIQVIGWYHTHPNELSLYMSNTDMNTQYRFFNQDWHYAIILNPHKEIWKAFVGKEAKECKGYILNDDDVSYTDTDHTKESSSNNIWSKKKVFIILILAMFLTMMITLWINQMIQKEQITKESDSIQTEVKGANIYDPKENDTCDDDIRTIDNTKLRILKPDSTFNDSLINKSE